MEKVWENNNDNKKKGLPPNKISIFTRVHSEWNVCFIIIFASLYKNLSICH